MVVNITTFSCQWLNIDIIILRENVVFSEKSGENIGFQKRSGKIYAFWLKVGGIFVKNSILTLVL